MKKPPIISFPPEPYDITVERMIAIAERLATEPMPTVVFISQRRCDQILKVSKEASVHTMHGLELRVQPGISDDEIEIHYSDGSVKFFEL